MFCSPFFHVISQLLSTVFYSFVFCLFILLCFCFLRLFWCFIKFRIHNEQQRSNGAAVISCAEAFLVVIRTNLSTSPAFTYIKSCLKFHSAEDKRQQSYVYEEQRFVAEQQVNNSSKKILWNSVSPLSASTSLRDDKKNYLSR